MIVGMPISAFTSVHVVISLIGIFSGFVVLLAFAALRIVAGRSFHPQPAGQPGLT